MQQEKEEKKREREKFKTGQVGDECRGVGRVKSSQARREVRAACGGNRCMQVAHCVQSAVGTEGLRRWYWMGAPVMVATSNGEGRTYVVLAWIEAGKKMLVVMASLGSEAREKHKSQKCAVHATPCVRQGEPPTLVLEFFWGFFSFFFLRSGSVAGAAGGDPIGGSQGCAGLL